MASSGLDKILIAAESPTHAPTALRVVIEEREACEVVGNHAAQADRNRLQELAQLEVSNHGVVDLEQQALPIPFVGSCR